MFQTKPLPPHRMTGRIESTVALALLFSAATVSTSLCPKVTGEQSASVPQLQQKGKGIFETRCATCHGLDGLGGEHAPDIIRQPDVSTLSDQALLNLIRDGIPQRGMPAFSDLANEDSHAVVAYMRLLQGKSGGNSAGNSISADPARGRELFFGRANCSACHQIAGHGQFIADDLTEFAKDHQAGEIRAAILSPPVNHQETATALARDGRRFSGAIRNEDNASLQLQDANGRLYLLMKSSLLSVQRKSGEPMPADYGKRLNTTELDDLVAFIRHNDEGRD